MHQRWDFLSPLTERGYVEPDDVQSIEQVFAKVPVAHKLVDVGIRGGYDPDVDLYWSRFT